MQSEIKAWWLDNIQSLARVTEVALEIHFRIKGGIDVAQGAYFSSANSRPPMYWAVKAAFGQPGFWHQDLVERLDALEAIQPGITQELSRLITTCDESFTSYSRSDMGEMDWAMGQANLFMSLASQIEKLQHRLLSS